MVLLVALVLIALVVSGPLADALGSKLGLGSAGVTVYQIAKWPIMAAVVLADARGRSTTWRRTPGCRASSG